MRDYKAPFAADSGALPVIAIPTTAGTGSECTRFTVITDTERDEKMLIAGLGALPLAAIVDYELTYQRAAAHHRRYRRRQPDPRAGGLCLQARQPVFRRAGRLGDGADRQHIRTAYAEPRNAAAREAMMLGATEAGLAFSNSSVALVHGMSRPIGAHFHVPHGLSNAMLLPAITRFLCRCRRSALRRGRTPHRLRGDTRCRCRGGSEAGRRPGNAEQGSLGADPGATSASTRRAWNGKMALMAEQALASGSPANNPRVPTRRRSLHFIARSGPAHHGTRDRPFASSENPAW